VIRVDDRSWFGMMAQAICHTLVRRGARSRASNGRLAVRASRAERAVQVCAVRGARAGSPRERLAACAVCPAGHRFPVHLRGWSIAVPGARQHVRRHGARALSYPSVALSIHHRSADGATRHAARGAGGATRIGLGKGSWPAAGHSNRGPATVTPLGAVQDSVSTSSATAVRGSSKDSRPQSANAPIAYGAVWTSAAWSEWPSR
jgi:hypothetical protein